MTLNMRKWRGRLQPFVTDLSSRMHSLNVLITGRSHVCRTQFAACVLQAIGSVWQGISGADRRRGCDRGAAFTQRLQRALRRRLTYR